jgi:osmotically-inducible protein OsmY
MLPLLARHHDRYGRSPFILRYTLAVAATLLGGVAATAAEPAPAASATVPAGISDVVLARSALSALDADPQLREINLVVSVVDRVAVIGGPVPTADLANRAEDLVRRIPGITQVKNKCFVQPTQDPLLRAIAGRIGPTPRTSITDLPGIVPTSRPATTGDPVPSPSENAIVMADPPGTTVVAQKPVLPPPSASGILLPPVAVSPVTTPPPPTPGVLTSVPPVPPPVVAAARPGDVQAAVDVVRKGDTRYAGLTIEHRDGMLVIAGTAARASDAWDLAQAVRRVPGVTRVVVGAVDVR